MIDKLQRRVEGLEQVIADQHKDVVRLYHQNKILKQALEEIAYADWEMTHHEYSLLVSRISRQALAGDKDD